MDLLDYDYRLPNELIAQAPSEPKSSSRLMVIKGKKIEHKRFYDILDYLNKGDVLVVNETKVSKNKIVGMKSTGSKVEVILMRQDKPYVYTCRIKGKAKVGSILLFRQGLNAEVIENIDGVYKIRFNKKNISRIIGEIGELPLPPYVREKLKSPSQYQTVYSKKGGSLAAPTAGLHFTEELMDKIKKKGIKIASICLHVGFGTFLPIRCSVEEHPMEPEYYEISGRAAETINLRKGRLIVVGTTTLKTLESSCTEEGKVKPGKGWSNIFIYPPYRFKSNPDALITNFHLPKSTLILLVSAYYGRDNILRAYKEAVKEKYRFYSLGDATLLLRDDTKEYLQPQ